MAVACVLLKAKIVFCPIVVPAVVEVSEIPITDTAEVVRVAWAAVLRFRIVFPVIVLIPQEETIPLSNEDVFAAAGK